MSKAIRWKALWRFDLTAQHALFVSKKVEIRCKVVGEHEIHWVNGLERELVEIVIWTRVVYELKFGHHAMSESEQRTPEVIQRFREGKITRSQAASMLGLSVRQVSRMRAKLQSEGPSGLVHGNVGREPPNKTPKDVARRNKELAESKYFDFNFVQMREHFLSDEDLVASYATIRRCCLEVGIAKHRNALQGGAE